MYTYISYKYMYNIYVHIYVLVQYKYIYIYIYTHIIYSTKYHSGKEVLPKLVVSKVVTFE